MTIEASAASIEVSTNTSTQRKSYALGLNKQEISIGRAPSNDIVIDEMVVSGFHLLIRRDGGQLVLIHPHPLQPQHKTTNGILFQGKHYQGDEPFTHVLSDGDVVRIGNQYGTMVALTYHDGNIIARQPVPDMAPIPLGAPLITIGRRPSNTVVLNHPQVSANHAHLERSGTTYRIVDQNSTNHVYVNGQRVTSSSLKPQDVIRIGPYDLVFTGTQLIQQSSSRSIRIDTLNLIQYGDKQKILLNDISLTIPSGKFVAIVGGSGAGKTTLMDALNGTRPAKAGRVLYNGQDYYSSRASFSAQLGYVPQFNIIHKNLTVERVLYYAAKLRLPSDTTDQQIEERMKEVMEAVGIAQRRKLLVKKLSGGQQTMLRNIADKEGHTIILVTHATNNINTCDYVCFLAPGGCLAYFGLPDEATAYFNQSDFADIYNALEPTDTDPDIPKKAEARFKQSSQYKQYVALPRSQMPPPQPGAGSSKPVQGNPWKQFRLLSARYLELLKNDRVNLLVLLLQAPIVAAILMLLIQFMLKPTVFTAQVLPITAEQVLFIMSFVAVLLGCNNSAREIVKEIQIYRRERMVNLGIMPYLFSKVLVLGILCLLQCAILVIAVNVISPFPRTVLMPPPLEIYVSLSLTSLVGLMIGLMISSVTANSDQANSIIPVILIFQILFSGVIFKLAGFGEVFGGLFAMRWSMIAMGSSVGLTAVPMGYDPQDSSFPYVHDASHVLGAWFALLVMIVIFGALTAYFLKRKDRLGR
ncbi:MAG: FHA domain-containing protein [Chloroflexi bacterium]|nr:MAG: FHA domain-containing protein [Chloroflexota bacterium]